VTPRRIVLLAGLCAVTAAIALEAGVRLFVPMTDEFFRPDPVAGLLHIEGREGRSVSREFDVRVRINADGFHDRERARAKAPGTRRVVVLGDSITEAFQVPLDDTFTARLERRLATDGRAVEVLNLGVSALGPPQEYLVYRAYGARYAPEVVVLTFFTANDFSDSLPELGGRAYLRYPVVGAGGTLARTADGEVAFTVPVAPSRARQWLRTHVASYRFVRERVLPLGPAAAIANDDVMLESYRDPLPERWQRATRVALLMVEELERAVRRDGARLVVLIVPAPWEVDGAYRARRAALRAAAVDWSRPERRLQDGLRARSIAVVSVSEAFAAAIARGARLYFPEDGHLTAAGHALVAERMAAALDRGL
jgi:lysophospholipase L1-like esterase